jgi:hypothetical protein
MVVLARALHQEQRRLELPVWQTPVRTRDQGSLISIAAQPKRLRRREVLGGKMYRSIVNRSFAKKVSFVVAAALGVICAAGPSHAALTQVGSRGALGADDFIDWGTLGGSGTTVASPFNIPTDNGLNVNVSKTPGGLFERRNQGSGWNGNFANGDRLLWTQHTTGPIVLDFANPVKGAGTQIQANFFGNFLGSIEAFDSANMSLGSFSLPGISNSNGDNSAIFLGVISDSFNIKKLVFNADHSQFFDDFAINRVDVVATPEPGTMALLGTGVVGLIARRRRRNTA